MTALTILILLACLVYREYRYAQLEEACRGVIQRGVIAPSADSVTRERVLHLPDVEQPQESHIEAALREDEILEELEQVRGDVRGLSPAEARLLYPQEWERLSQLYAEQRTPLRI